MHCLGDPEHQQQAAHSRRARPPDLDLIAGEESKVPLRAQTERLHRRRSRLALSGLFGRHKPVKDPEPVELKEPPPRSGGIRASLAGIGNWPYGLNGQRSESALSSIPQLSEPAAKSPLANVNVKPKKPTSTVRPQPLPRPTRGSLATWDPPPLFQSYPQAIKHARLPARTLTAEALLKLHSQKGSVSLREGLNQSSLNLETIEESAAEKSDRSKKKHRRNTSASSLKADWTTKIYVLVTSGYLLQYCGEGSFDRLPEKVLQLGKDSAAFASDVIPGRHWVLQVSSIAEADGAASGQSTSLFSRLPFRGAERRHASNFLMVFESADDMDSWIATLRREIEALGGKKNLSETGKPKVDDMVLQLRVQTSQRTLVVKDPDRFSRSISHLPWDPPASMTSPDIHIDGSDMDAAREQSFDETSTTSGISQDGRQLDGLRDSTNRLSFISSGQRTMVTSAGSSPACSPTRDSFASQPEELTLRDIPPPAEAQLRVLPRPNASVINDRRQSMQAMNHMFDMRLGLGGNRPHSTYANSPPAQTTIPNFSVPHSAGKRYSLIKPSPQDHASPASPLFQLRAPPAKPFRRPPCSALSINPRPLSLVEDQPSPTASPESRNRRIIRQEEMRAPDTPSMFSTWAQESSHDGQLGSSDLPSRSPSPLSQGENRIQVTVHGSPRKHASMTTIRPSDMEPGQRAETRILVLPEKTPMSSAPSASATRASAEIPRSKSAMDSYTRSRSPPPTSAKISRHQKHMSLNSPISDAFPRYSMAESDLTVTSVDSQDLLSGPISPNFRPRSMAPRISTSNQHLRIDSFSRDLPNRRSMSQLVEGPPPAPPPTCALPPIPRKVS
ncbi:hypothetical protein QBC33DRAFT_611488 [Phialemonium atrogriseum]|uniref:PH domain-containing protein n=1 Tax=Phialemonium atrogriseum TaxID=1093897 RepID=A0AAJ0BYX6_9PEZI|nr:uncharacterized protein QBC33DRAFT_611488 [Phialemonium atrogriseum]KAK1766816.1 hypothetical protein QBC33DRAFT_611488 [Phialemonium atrogriseum]